MTINTNSYQIPYNNQLFLSNVQENETKESIPVESVETQTTMDAALIKAILDENFDACSSLIHQGANVNLKDGKSDTALLLSFRNKSNKIIKLLVENGANVNTPDINGCTPLCIAVYTGRIRLAEYLLAKGADVNQSSAIGKITALHLATQKKRIDLVKLLVENRADVNHSDEEGINALLTATAMEQMDIVKLLVENGADVNFLNPEGSFPLRIATVSGNIELVKFFLKNGVNVNQKGISTAIIQAVLYHNINLVKLLIDHGADLSSINVAPDDSTYSSLATVAIQGRLELVNLLLEKGVKKIDDAEQAIEFATCLMTTCKKYKKIYSTVCSVPLNEILPNIKQQIQTKAVYDSHDLNSKTVTFYPLDDTKTAIVSRLPLHHVGWIKRILSSFKYFKNINDALPKMDLLEEALSLAIDNVPAKEEKYMKQILSGDLTLLLTGFNEHAGALLIWGKHFVILDRRKERQPFTIDLFDPKKINLAILKRILSSPSNGDEDYQKLLSDLPKELGFEKKQPNDIASILELCCPLGNQIVGNCVYASLEGVVWTFFVLNRLLKPSLPPMNGSDANSFQPDRLREIIEEESNRFWLWQAFNRSYQIEKYLKTRIIRPNKAQSKPEEWAYKLDSQLVLASLTKVNSCLDPRIRQIFDKLKGSFDRRYQSNKELFTPLPVESIF